LRRAGPADDRRGPARPNDGQGERADHEQRAEDRRGLRQDRRALSRAERGLAATAAKGAGDIAAPALLQQDDQEEQLAGDHVQGDDGVVEHSP
jgi:hypothetical protein